MTSGHLLILAVLLGLSVSLEGFRCGAAECDETEHCCRSQFCVALNESCASCDDCPLGSKCCDFAPESSCKKSCPLCGGSQCTASERCCGSGRDAFCTTSGVCEAKMNRTCGTTQCTLGQLCCSINSTMTCSDVECQDNVIQCGDLKCQAGQFCCRNNNTLFCNDSCTTPCGSHVCSHNETCCGDNEPFCSAGPCRQKCSGVYCESDEVCCRSKTEFCSKNGCPTPCGAVYCPAGQICCTNQKATRCENGPECPGPTLSSRFIVLTVCLVALLVCAAIILFGYRRQRLNRRNRFTQHTDRHDDEDKVGENNGGDDSPKEPMLKSDL